MLNGDLVESLIVVLCFPDCANQRPWSGQDLSGQIFAIYAFFGLILRVEVGAVSNVKKSV